MAKVAKWLRSRQNRRDMSVIIGFILVWGSVPIVFVSIAQWDIILAYIGYVMLMTGFGAYVRGL